MTLPLLDAGTIAELQAIRLQGLAQPGLTIGGSSWQVESVSGDGIGEDTTPSLGTAYDGSVEQAARTREAQANAGSYYDALWVHVITDDDPPDLAPGAIIQGSGARFRIVGPILDPLYPTYACDLA